MVTSLELPESFQLQQSCSGGTHTCPTKILYHRVNPELLSQSPGKQPLWAVPLGSASNTAFIGPCTTWNSAATALSDVRTRTGMILESETAGYILTKYFLLSFPVLFLSVTWKLNSFCPMHSVPLGHLFICTFILAALFLMVHSLHLC